MSNTLYYYARKVQLCRKGQRLGCVNTATGHGASSHNLAFAFSCMSDCTGMINKNPKDSVRRRFRFSLECASDGETGTFQTECLRLRVRLEIFAPRARLPRRPPKKRAERMRSHNNNSEGGGAAKSVTTLKRESREPRESKGRRKEVWSSFTTHSRKGRGNRTELHTCPCSFMSIFREVGRSVGGRAGAGGRGLICCL